MTGLGETPEQHCLLSWEDVHCCKAGVPTGRWKEG